MSKINKLKINGQEYTIEGKSAYEVAVDNGFEGTEEEWLESLKGESGDTTEIHLEAGTGEWAEFAIVQKDDSNDPNTSPNYTNATHAAVFGNNNGVIATRGDDHNARNGFIGGGLQNFIFAENSFIGGGQGNTVGDQKTNISRAGIVGGNENTIKDRSYGFIGGGQSNTVAGVSGAVVGGKQNTATRDNSFIGGGENNTVNGENAFASGIDNTSSGKYAVTFGNLNTANGPGNFVGGGFRNTVSGDHGATLGGNTNEVSGKRSVIAGGTNNKLTGVDSFIGAGKGLKSETDYQVLFGKWNAYDTGAELIFGGGTSDTDRKNDYTLRKGGTPEKATDLVPKRYVDALEARIKELESQIAVLNVMHDIIPNV